MTSVANTVAVEIVAEDTFAPIPALLALNVTVDIAVAAYTDADDTVAVETRVAPITSVAYTVAVLTVADVTLVTALRVFVLIATVETRVGA